MKRSFLVSEISRNSWQMLKPQLFSFAGLFVVYIILMTFLRMLLSPTSEAFWVQSLISSVVTIFLSIIFTLGYLKNFFLTMDGEEPQLAVFKEVFPQSGRYFVAEIVYALIVIIGLCLFIIPGIYLGLRLQYYRAAIVEDNKGAIESLKYSWCLTKGYVFQLFVLGIVMILLVLVGLLALVIGFFITYPVIQMMYVYSYRILKSNYE